MGWAFHLGRKPRTLRYRSPRRQSLAKKKTMSGQRPRNVKQKLYVSVAVKDACGLPIAEHFQRIRPLRVIFRAKNPKSDRCFLFCFVFSLKLMQCNVPKDRLGPNKTFKNKWWSTFNDHKKTLAAKKQQQKTHHIHLNAGIKLNSSCIPPVSTLAHGGQIESLLRKKRGLQLMSLRTHHHVVGMLRFMSKT